MTSESSLQWWLRFALHLIAAITVASACILLLDYTADTLATSSALQAPGVEAPRSPAAE